MREYLIIHHHFVKLAAIALFIDHTVFDFGLEVVFFGVFGVVAGKYLAHFFSWL